MTQSSPERACGALQLRLLRRRRHDDHARVHPGHRRLQRAERLRDREALGPRRRVRKVRPKAERHSSGRIGRRLREQRRGRVVRALEQVVVRNALQARAGRQRGGRGGSIVHTVADVVCNIKCESVLAMPLRRNCARRPLQLKRSTARGARRPRAAAALPRTRHACAHLPRAVDGEPERAAW
jgi:hypothetical protein